ncbi:three-Cys-motif partner protein TcmP [Haladaptatus salinisoli]|uniref:three-Cys-motif partner protein TcmP n=1 Tax=Haladaptatus salinisoli TaxID=2884876 RepID=UPI001D0A03A9|nr:three-Cys-motif partner protein TcmP [Haladaptatus salinisoli]
MSNGERQWIQERVDSLTGDGPARLKEIHPEVCNSFGPWSALKLILHSATVNMYTKVMSGENSPFDEFYYVDALAGTGLSEYENGDCFLGSPILASKSAAEPFKKMYFIEGDTNNAEALEARLELAFNDSYFDVQEPEDWEVLPGDTNERIDDVVTDIWRQRSPGAKFHTLTFVDNQAMDFDWVSMEKMAELSTDFLVTYQGAQAVGMNINIEATHRGKLKDHFGRNLWDHGLETREDYKQTYIKQMRSLFNSDSIQIPTKIYSGRKSYDYDVVYGTRETKNGSGYVDAVKYVKEFVENFDGRDVEDMIEVINGNQSVMEDFLPKNAEIDESLLGGNNKDEDQRSLTDWC